MNEIATKIQVSTITDDDVIDRIAKEIGKGVAAHIQTMYPEASEAVAWNSCARSIEGFVRNNIASAGKAAENGGIDEWLARTRKRRLDSVKRSK